MLFRSRADDLQLDHVAVSIDARNLYEDLKKFPDIFQSLDDSSIEGQIIFLDAEDNTLLKRFSETRRKHPLSDEHMSLMEAILYEKELLGPIASLADLNLDTTSLSLHQLRDVIKNRVAMHEGGGLALQFQSFGFKHGLPADADIVFDTRCLPNPYWEESLRPLSGQDAQVIEFLEQQDEVGEMLGDICNYLEKWLPRFHLLREKLLMKS